MPQGRTSPAATVSTEKAAPDLTAGARVCSAKAGSKLAFGDPWATGAPACWASAGPAQMVTARVAAAMRRAMTGSS